VVSILLLLSVIFSALVGLPILWWQRGSCIPQLDFTGPQGRTTAHWKAAESICLVRGQKAYA
jgi:hypothetical protein